MKALVIGQPKLFLIEQGPVLDLVRYHLEQYGNARRRAQKLCEECGASSYQLSHDGRVIAVRFKGDPHPDFKKETRAGSIPKKRTEWAERFSNQICIKTPEALITERLGVPVFMWCRAVRGHGTDRVKYSASLGTCGFMSAGKDGPYGMWVPDVPTEVAREESDGATVLEPVKSFKLEFEGCRPITREEWDSLDAQAMTAKSAAVSDEETGSTA